MKFRLKYFAYAGCLFLFLTACAPYKIFPLEIQEPAPITLPRNIRDVIVINNAVPQPSTQSVTRQYKQEEYTYLPLSFDTMAWIATYTIADVLTESGFFENVEVYTQAIRDDSDFLFQKKLRKDVQDDFLTDLDYDMILSVDRLVFSIEETVLPVNKRSDNGEKNIKLTVHGMLSGSTYTKETETPLTLINETNQLIFDSVLLADSVGIFKTLPESMTELLTQSLAENLAERFIPFWIKTERILYTGINSRMQEAYSYMNKNNFDEAVVVWESLLKEQNKPLNKAKLYSNLTVGYELKGDFQKALQQAEQSQIYFKEAGDKATEGEVEWIESYILALKKRIQDDEILDEQLTF